MTLIVAAQTPQSAVMVADGRLTSTGGDTLTEESVKLALVTLWDGRFALGLAGLSAVGSPTKPGPASLGGFRTFEWVLDAVCQASAPDRLIPPTLERFTQRLTDDFNPPGHVPSRDRAVIVAISGIRDDGTNWRPVMGHMTNMLDDGSIADEFTASFMPESRDHGLMMVPRPAGIIDAETQPIWDLLMAKRPAHAIADRTVEFIRDVGVARGGGTVGPFCQSIEISATANNLPYSARQHAHEGLTTYRLPHAVQVETDGSCLQMMDIIIRSGPEGARETISYPRVHKSAPCPCGSGRKYRSCHGRRRRRESVDQETLQVGPYLLPFGSKNSKPEIE